MGRGGSSRGDQAFEPDHVDLVLVEDQAIAVRPGLDDRTGDCPAQPGDQGLQGVRRLGRWPAGPDPVDQVGRRDHPARVQRQDDQQGAQAVAGHGDSVPLSSWTSSGPSIPIRTHPILPVGVTGTTTWSGNGNFRHDGFCYWPDGQ
jgi:hypothetical protein